MLSALREELQQLMQLAPASRRPSLRRSDLPGALLATDLPLIAEEDDLTALISAAMAAGWRIGFLPNGWMWLDHDVPAPMLIIPAGVQGEAGCCLSLLLRHPGGEEDRSYIRAIVKADEAGPKEVEKLCRAWHTDFAGRLRRHERLPAVLPWLCAAIRHHAKKEAES